MVAVIDAVGLLLILFVNTAIAAFLTRFFRVQLVTDWGSALYAVLVTPVVQLVVVLLLSGLFKLGPDVGNAAVVVGLAILVPLSVGVAFDYFWMPAPEDLDLPRQRSRDRRRSL
jgi:hypothetical protein